MPPRVLVFDVNETLLDLTPLDPFIDRVLGRPGLRPRWFARMLQIAFAGALAGGYVDYPTAMRAALEGLAGQEGRVLSEADAMELRVTVASLPAHPEVPDALGRLRDAGFRLVALTNGTREVALEQMRASGLAPLLDGVLSCDDAGALKPSPRAYAHAVQWAGVPASELRMIAAHDWDVQGAMAAGLAGAFVARPGQAWAAVWAPPDVIGADMADVADQLVAAPGRPGPSR
jgi:2-haloacid dehalogenase